jgi:hypothetical protein
MAGPDNWNLGPGGPMLMWEGPGILPEPVPASALIHTQAQQ